MRNIKVPRNERKDERVLSYFPWCKEVELSGYLGRAGIQYEVGSKRASRAFNKRVVFHSHPSGKNAGVPSPEDIMKFAYLGKAKESIIVCPKVLIVLSKGAFDRNSADFMALSLLWSSGKIDSRWIKNWPKVVRNLGMGLGIYERS